MKWSSFEDPEVGIVFKATNMLKFIEKHIIKILCFFIVFHMYMAFIYYTCGTRSDIWFYSLLVAYPLDFICFAFSMIILLRYWKGKCFQNQSIWPIIIILLLWLFLYRKLILLLFTSLW